MSAYVGVYRCRCPKALTGCRHSDGWVVEAKAMPWRPYEVPRRFATWSEAMRYADRLARQDERKANR